MIEGEIEITSKYGLRAKSAESFVEAASRFTSEIEVLKDGQLANAKSIISVLNLDARQGDRIVIRAEGPDEETAFVRLSGFLREE